MKKGFLLVPLLTSAVLLGGCGNSQVSHSTHQNNAVKTNKIHDKKTVYLTKMAWVNRLFLI